MKSYDGKVKRIFKQFPLGNHPWAKPAAIASLCVYDQNPNDFWKIHDMFFSSQGTLTPTNVTEKAKEFASTLKLDMTQLESCLTDSKVAARVERDLQEGETLGVSGTPTFFINGKKLVGAQPEQAFRELIETSLKK